MSPRHRFRHFMHGCYMGQMADVVCDIPTIEIHSLDTEDGKRVSAGKLIQSHDRDMAPARARNVWKNCGGEWEHHPLRNDFAGFYVAWFAKLAAEMGLESPIKTPSDLLFDYPKLLQPAWLHEEGTWEPEFDYLVINSRPCSGQFMAYDHVNYFDPLIQKLRSAGKSVVVTQDSTVAMASGARCTASGENPLTITQIGNLSLRCKNIVAVATGPLWPALNVWSNPEKLIIAIGVPERNIAKGAIYCGSLAAVEKEIGV